MFSKQYSGKWGLVNFLASTSHRAVFCPAFLSATVKRVRRLRGLTVSERPPKNVKMLSHVAALEVDLQKKNALSNKALRSFLFVCLFGLIDLSAECKQPEFSGVRRCGFSGC